MSIREAGMATVLRIALALACASTATTAAWGAEPPQPVEGKKLTFQSEAHSYTFAVGDELIANKGLFLCDTSDDLDPHLLSSDFLRRARRYVEKGDRVTVEDYNPENGAVAVRYMKDGKELRGWVDGYWLCPVDFQGVAPEEDSGWGGLCCTVVALVAMLASPFLVRMVAGPKVAAVFVALPFSGCLVAAGLAMLFGTWLGVVVMLVLALGCLGLMVYYWRSASTVQ